MSLHTHIRYTLSCDKCGSFYYGGKKYADSKVLIFRGKSVGWVISDNGCSQVCICPDCAKKEGVQDDTK